MFSDSQLDELEQLVRKEMERLETLQNTGIEPAHKDPVEKQKVTASSRTTQPMTGNNNINSDKKTSSDISIDEHSVIEEVLRHFQTLALQKKTEADTVKLIIQQDSCADIKTANDIAIDELEKRLASYGYERSNNIYVRINLAKQGLFSEYLKEDSVSTVRFEVLRATGKFSSHYRERERHPLVIREFIRQGIDLPYFATQSEQSAKWVMEQKVINQLILDIQEANPHAMSYLNKAIPRSEGLLEQYLEGADYISFIYQGAEPRMNELRLDEKREQEKIAHQTNIVLSTLKVEAETPLGYVQYIDNNEIVIEDFEGILVRIKPHELFSFVMHDAQSQQPSLERRG